MSRLDIEIRIKGKFLSSPEYQILDIEYLIPLVLFTIHYSLFILDVDGEWVLPSLFGYLHYMFCGIKLLVTLTDN